MKFNVLIAAVTLFLLSAANLAAQEKNKKELSSVRFETSIDCEGCVSTIMKNIPFEKGVKDVKCDLTTKEVTVQYQKDKTSAENLRRSIEKLGYTAEEVTEKQKKEEGSAKGNDQ
ncbi:MAG: heavy-metal-associated domain-containing protein [Bacteroidales bacterium]|jgi:copper chaperone CopZ|nr:heavy-metal-associated domain-containing protein [Bacteroidales bacterium]